MKALYDLLFQILQEGDAKRQLHMQKIYRRKCLCSSKRREPLKAGAITLWGRTTLNEGKREGRKVEWKHLKCSTIPKNVWPGHLESFRLSKSHIFPERAYLNIHAMFSHWLVAANGQWCLKTKHSDGVQSTSAWGQRLVPAEVWKATTPTNWQGTELVFQPSLYS